MTPAPDVYTALTDYGSLLDFESPSSSLLLNKGAHSGGPALEADQYALVLEWIRLEATWRVEVPDEVIETPVVQPVPGPNTIPLDSLGLPGSTVSFNYQALASGMYLTDVSLIAGPDGATIEHPLFVTWENESPSPDPLDRFVELSVAAEPMAASPIGGGYFALANVAPGAGLSIHFRAVRPEGPNGPGGGGGGLEGGCKDVVAFSANAAPGLNANCSGCHGGGNGAATAALDISQLGVDDSNACGQVLSRVTLADPANSAIFLATNPAAGSTHPFQFANVQANFDAFQAAVSLWITAENNAP
jgi:hypothetical protein